MRGGAGRRGIGRQPVAILVLAIVAALTATGATAWASGRDGAPAHGPAGASGKILAIGAESQYADVIDQVGGDYVTTSAVMSNPNTDPHTFEASIAVAREVGDAALVVQNGLGYDDFMTTIESATPSQHRRVIDVQRLLGLPDGTANPHLWYDPAAMARVADAVAGGLAAADPAHAAYFTGNAARFKASLGQLTAAITDFKASYGGTAVAVTEPVADYLLTALGTDNLTPWTFQADVMNGTDPSPQNVAVQRSLFTAGKVRVFLYNQQVTDALTESFIALARQDHVPVVGVYETMPAPGYDYQTWLLAEVQALRKAVAAHVSTEHL